MPTYGLLAEAKSEAPLQASARHAEENLGRRNADRIEQELLRRLPHRPLLKNVQITRPTN